MKRKNYWKGKNGPLLIAEIGGNHEGNFNYAKRMAKLAISTGVDAVKFQLYKGSSLVSPVESIERHKHFNKFELTKNQHIQIAKICKKSGVDYLASVWDEEMLEWIDKYLKYYKIGSGDLTAYPIIENLAKRGKPIILSTGLSNLKEIKDVIRFIQKKNKIYKSKKNLSILQCTSTYPTLDEEVNLNVIKTLKKETKLTVGYSHHNEGDLALLVAYLTGAEILEFHFTDSRKNKTFRDHKISLTAEETKNLIKKINKINKLQGNKNKIATQSEIKSKNITTFRRAVYSKKYLKKGEKIKKEDLIYLRPNHGIDAREYKKILGKKVRKNTIAFKKLLVK